ncbi:hypothetical protein VM636_04955 [Streptomyces sp. SCSIO 75703]|uniref:hypothetical protein n=1 Tax=unclassified Streptomyces TaxID=2593676 RepID=UPI0006B6887B|nr:hypothetical protein [Streptomyces sp. TP-A0875]
MPQAAVGRPLAYAGLPGPRHGGVPARPPDPGRRPGETGTPPVRDTTTATATGTGTGTGTGTQDGAGAPGALGAPRALHLPGMSGAPTRHPIRVRAGHTGLGARTAAARVPVPGRRPAAGRARRRGRGLAVAAAPSAAVGTLLAVLLTLLPSWPQAGARVAPGGPLPAHSSTAVPRPDSGYHPDDGCTATCGAQARPRHDQLVERPAPPEHHATVARHPGSATRAVHGRGSAAPVPVPVSPGRSAHDRGRAPPAPSGT